jgi:ribosomal protein L37AE/L43A
MTERNPIFIPEPIFKRPCCPFCENPDFTGRNIQGSVLFTCLKCNKQWQGGLQQVPLDPREPMAPSATPAIEYVGIRNRKGDVVSVEELRRKVDLTTDFRRGAPIPEEGED